MIYIEVTYLTEHEQNLIRLELPKNTTLIAAIQHTTLLQRFPEIDLLKNKVGIFGKIVALETPLNDGDRVEIYRPLSMDPKQKRMAKLKK